MLCRCNKGMTLTEMLITLAICSIVLGIVIPSTGHIINANRLTTQVNELRSSLALTRSEAIKTNQQVVICKSQDNQYCIRQGQWQQGWIVFIDQNRDRRRDEQEPLLLAKQALPQRIELRYQAFGSRHYIAYYPTGITNTNGTFTFCDTNATNRSIALILSKTGRIRLHKARSGGRPLNCD